MNLFANLPECTRVIIVVIENNCMARHIKMTDEVIGKLEQAFAFGCSDLEACRFADINPSTLYDYCRKNPEFSEKKSMLKLEPVLKAKKTLFDSLEDVKVAQWYLERKCKEDFNTKTEQKSPEDIPLSALRVEVISLPSGKVQLSEEL